MLGQLTVLEVVLEENLQGHALMVGERMIRGLKGLMGDHEIIGNEEPDRHRVVVKLRFVPRLLQRNQRGIILGRAQLDGDSEHCRDQEWNEAEIEKAS